MSKKADTLNEAIVNKVDSILKNTQCIDSMYITIEGNRGEVPTISYRIRELIVPEENTREDKEETNNGRIR